MRKLKKKTSWGAIKLLTDRVRKPSFKSRAKVQSPVTANSLLKRP